MLGLNLLKTTDLALMILEGWQASSRLTETAYHQMSEVAQACADELGEDMPDNAMTHGMIVAWLRKQPNVWNDGKMREIPRQEIYLGLPE